MRWWRAFTDRKPGEADAESDRRRRDSRFPESMRVALQCASWPELATLFTGNLSAGGLFVASETLGELGEAVTIDLILPSGLRLAMTGHIRNRVTVAEATERGTSAGMGIALDPLLGDARTTFEKILAQAQASVPRPADAIASGSPEPAPARRKPTHEPDASMRHSVMMRVVDASDLVQAFGGSGENSAPHLAPPSSKPRRHKAGGGPTIGIDLGLRYTSVAALRGTRVAVLETPERGRTSPSVVHIAADGRVVVGAAAQRLLHAEPGRTVPSPKRLLGASPHDSDVLRWLGDLPLETFVTDGGSWAVVIDGRAHTAEDLVSHVLADVRELAVDQLGTDVRQAVVSVPLRWTEDHVAALRRAGELAGLDIVAVLDEPTAVAMAHRFDPSFGGKLGVLDIGGTSCDFSILDAQSGDLRVLATSGDTGIGGDSLDRVLAEAAAEYFQRLHQVDLHRVAGAWPQLLAAAEQARRDLSAAASAAIVVPRIAQAGGKWLNLSLGIDRGLLERAAGPLLDRIRRVCDKTAALAGLAPGSLATVYASGGLSYTPIVRGAVAAHLGVEVRSGVPPELAICLGAAMHAAMLQLDRRLK